MPLSVIQSFKDFKWVNINSLVNPSSQPKISNIIYNRCFFANFREHSITSLHNTFWMLKCFLQNDTSNLLIAHFSRYQRAYAGLVWGITVNVSLKCLECLIVRYSIGESGWYLIVVCWKNLSFGIALAIKLRYASFYFNYIVDD